MIVKQIIDEDFINYKKPAMYIAFPTCKWKCGKNYCQNSEIVKLADIEISIEDIVERYRDNPITSAIVCGGLEPLDDLPDLYLLITAFREHGINDDIVIYTGYEEKEIMDDEFSLLKDNKNIIVKFGRYIPKQEPHYDNVLGVMLASDNQYGKVIS